METEETGSKLQQIVDEARPMQDRNSFRQAEQTIAKSKKD